MRITRIKTNMPLFTFGLIFLYHFYDTLCQPMCTGLHFINRIISSHYPSGVLPDIIRKIILLTPIIITPLRHIIIKSKILRRFPIADMPFTNISHLNILFRQFLCPRRTIERSDRQRYIIIPKSLMLLRPFTRNQTLTSRTTCRYT